MMYYLSYHVCFYDEVYQITVEILKGQIIDNRSHQMLFSLFYIHKPHKSQAQTLGSFRVHECKKSITRPIYVWLN